MAKLVEASQRGSIYAELAHALGVSAISRAFALVAGLVINGLLARLLPQSDFAFLGVLISLAAIVMVPMLCGYQISIVKVAGEAAHSGDTEELAASLLAGTLAVIVFTVFLTPIFLKAGHVVLPDLEAGSAPLGTLILSLAFISTLTISVFYAEALRGLGQVGAASSLTGLGQHGGIVRSLIVLILVGLVELIAPVQLNTFLVVGCVASLAACFFSLRLLRRHRLLRTSIGQSWASFRRNSLLNANMMFGQFFQIAGGAAAATVVGGAFISGQPLALFVAARQLAVGITAPLTLFNGASPKLIISAHRSGDIAGLERLIRIGASSAFAIALAASVALIAGGPWLFRLLFGEGYSGAAPFFAALAPGIVFNAFGGSAARGLILLGFEKSFLIFSFLTSFIAIPLYIMVSLLYGPLGLALGMSIILVLQNVALIAMARRYLGVWTCAYLAPKEYVYLVRAALRRSLGWRRRSFRKRSH